MFVLRLLLVWCALNLAVLQAEQAQFSSQDVVLLKSFTLSALPALPASPSNQWADNEAAALLGKELFFDTSLSIDKTVSCASCHQPEKYFTDGLALSVALSTTRRNSPSIPNALYGPWQFWDGRADSLWSQALMPLEDAKEHGMSRIALAKIMEEDYEDAFIDVFDDKKALKVIRKIKAERTTMESLSDKQKDAVNRVFSHIGKAIMAYERKLKLRDSKFDDFVADLEQQKGNAAVSNLFNETEIAGLRVFMGKGNCASCHNGPMFTNFEFHNIGAPEPDTQQVDLGRFNGVDALRNSEFNCLTVYSDASIAQCEEMNFLKTQGPELVGAFKTPSLRNISETAPYMQAGQFETLEQVVAHYNAPTPPFYDREQHPSRPHFDIVPLKLSEQEQTQLVSFLKTLVSPLPRDDPWWFP